MGSKGHNDVKKRTDRINVLSVKIDGKTGNCIIDCDYIPKVGEISG